MKLLAIGVSALVNIICAAPARAQRLVEITPQMTWFERADGSFAGIPTFLLLLMLFAGIGIIIAFLFHVCQDSGPGEAPEERTEQYEQETLRMRAEARRADAENELIRSQINKARSAAEYAEIGEITDHDRRVRGLRRKL